MISYSIALATLNMPRDICHIVEKHKTKYYTYAFQTHEGIFNYGKAADNEWMSGTWGNRIYRKGGGIPGWNYMLEDSSASKMTELMKLYLPLVQKNNVVITVNDYTTELLAEEPFEIDRFLLDEENKLVRAYEFQFGRRPLLNIQDTRSHPNFKKMFNALFEEIDA